MAGYEGPHSGQSDKRSAAEGLRGAEKWAFSEKLERLREVFITYDEIFAPGNEVVLQRNTKEPRKMPKNARTSNAKLHNRRKRRSGRRLWRRNIWSSVCYWNSSSLSALSFSSRPPRRKDEGTSLWLRKWKALWSLRVRQVTQRASPKIAGGGGLPGPWKSVQLGTWWEIRRLGNTRGRSCSKPSITLLKSLKEQGMGGWSGVSLPHSMPPPPPDSGSSARLPA